RSHLVRQPVSELDRTGQPAGLLRSISKYRPQQRSRPGIPHTCKSPAGAAASQLHISRWSYRTIKSVVVSVPPRRSVIEATYAFGKSDSDLDRPEMDSSLVDACSWTPSR